MTFRPTVRVAEPDRELRWLGRVLLPGIFDGEHAFIIEPQASGCRLRHEETFSGLLVPAFGAMLDDTARSFAELNARAEAARRERMRRPSSYVRLCCSLTVLCRAR